MTKMTNKSADELYEELNASLKRASKITEKKRLESGEYIMVGDRIQPNPDHPKYAGQFDEDTNSEYLDRIDAALDRLTGLIDKMDKKLDITIDTLKDIKNEKN